MFLQSFSQQALCAVCWVPLRSQESWESRAGSWALIRLLFLCLLCYGWHRCQGWREVWAMSPGLVPVLPPPWGCIQRPTCPFLTWSGSQEKWTVPITRCIPGGPPKGPEKPLLTPPIVQTTDGDAHGSITEKCFFQNTSVKGINSWNVRTFIF